MLKAEERHDAVGDTEAHPEAEILKLPLSAKDSKPSITEKQWDAEEKLIQQLRDEANELKECFTRYSFQAVSITIVALGVIIRYMAVDPRIGLAGLPIMLVPLVVLRIGSYKYTGANRNFGYELHLSRTRDVPSTATGRWKNEYRFVDWEAAMRAWRIVEATLFEEIHEDDLLKRKVVRRQYRPTKDRPIWFCQKFLFGHASRATWYPGSYLLNMQGLLRWTAFDALFLVWLSTAAQLVRVMTSPHPKSSAAFWTIGAAKTAGNITFFDVGLLAISLFAAIGGAVYLRNHRLREDVKRARVEDGIHSIHSCAIIWQAVIIAHYSALERARKCGLSSWKLANMTKCLSRQDKRDLRSGRIRFEYIIERTHITDEDHLADGAGLTGYTFWLGQEADSLARWACDVPGWIGLGEERLREIHRAPQQRFGLIKS